MSLPLSVRASKSKKLFILRQVVFAVEVCQFTG